GANQRAFVLVNDSDTTIAFLKSRYVVDQIIKKFNLIKYYKVKDIAVARKTLMGVTTTIPDAKSGLLEIDVDYKNPKMAADIANTYVTELGGLISSIGLNTALHKRQFYDSQIVQVKKDLAQAQKALQDFMIKNGITAGAQTSIVTGISTQLQAQLAVAQSQLISMQRYATADNPDYKALQSQIKSLKSQILNLSGTTSTVNDNISIPANLAPQLSQEYINLITHVAFIAEMYSLLTKQYEANKLDELIDQKPISVQVIDYAEPPLYKSKPKRLKIILSTFFLGFLVSFIYVIFKNRASLVVK
ncbi:MAG: hypothetical protein QG673_909, partial [Pseudomonadota bacterium]|nr:hypothetical protein [Pseudomonadota bacterium]